MNQNQNPTSTAEQQRIEQILTYARTFRRHPLILLGRKQVSPYDLAYNGFVNKNFEEEKKLQNLNDQQMRQVVCICRGGNCSKTFRFNEKIEGEENDEDVETMLTQHAENCPFHGKKFERFTVSELFNVAHLFFDKIKESFSKDESRMVESLKINWSIIEDFLLPQSSQISKMNLLLECYKNIDHKFSIQTKRFNNTILLSLFGWKMSSVKENANLVLRCHFCSKKLQKQQDSEMNPFTQHNIWCLIRREQYEMWKLMLKKKYTTTEKQYFPRELQKKTYEFVLPKSESEIESKQIREELFEAAKPALQKIDELLEMSLGIVRKQRHLNEGLLERRIVIGQDKEKDGDEQLEKYLRLDEISKKCQDIIKNFINSIESKRV